ncbi:MAG: helix-turn-helix domain-containing protein [Actinobacteria bacterium]|jgi:transcriptional regulator with XRE-family HTH domain|nr:helix-turn-helix domain-containing protein [Actinomycetota bacterium]
MKKNYKKATRLRVILAQKGISQKDLAGMTGLEVYQVSNLCTGKKPNPMLDTAKKICYSLGVTLDEAFGDEFGD